MSHINKKKKTFPPAITVQNVKVSNTNDIEIQEFPQVLQGIALRSILDGQFAFSQRNKRRQHLYYFTKISTRDASGLKSLQNAGVCFIIIAVVLPV